MGIAKPRIAIIGAGPSGIAAAKRMLAAGLDRLVVFDRNMEVGGNWIYNEAQSHSSVFETTHIISSKTWSQYEDFPMPTHYPDYPSHRQLLDYFQAYAKHFGILPYIRFGTSIQEARPSEEGWALRLATGEVEHFDYLLVANGHHWSPRIPHYEGTFSGTFLHSHDYKNNRAYAGKRVLVIGGGNSACDCAVETARVSEKTTISMRRGYYIIPKFMMGEPTDVVSARSHWLPKFIRKPLLKLALRLEVGSYEAYGLQKPRDPLLSVHPTLNSELLYALRHGKVEPKPDIAYFAGKTVCFKDGTSDEFDVIIACTGYYIRHPFFDKALIDYEDKEVPLFLRVFHPNHRNLFFIGLVQPLGCIWPLADKQAALVAQHIKGAYKLPPNMPQRIAKELVEIRQQYQATPRHTVEVDYHDYLKALQKELKKATT